MRPGPRIKSWSVSSMQESPSRPSIAESTRANQRASDRAPQKGKQRNQIETLGQFTIAIQQQFVHRETALRGTNTQTLLSLGARYCCVRSWKIEGLRRDVQRANPGCRKKYLV